VLSKSNRDVCEESGRLNESWTMEPMECGEMNHHERENLHAPDSLRCVQEGICNSCMIKQVSVSHFFLFLNSML
jgi:hypothetical protein